MSASRVALVLAATALVLVPVSSMAQTASEEVVTTARAARLPTQADMDKAKADAQARSDAAAKPLTTQEQITAWLADAPRIDRSSNGASDDAAQPSGPRQIHGEVSVSIGTGGYRSTYASSYIPVGETGILGIAVSQTDFGKNSTYPYGYDYGYRGYSYGGWGQRGGRSQSVSLSLDMTGSNRNASGTPKGCAPGFRDGDHYIEPVWVTRMHDGRACEADDQQ